MNLRAHRFNTSRTELPARHGKRYPDPARPVTPRTGEATIAELVNKYGVHQTLVNSWKRQAIEGMAGVVSGTAEAAAAERDGEVEKLHGARSASWWWNAIF